MRKSRGQEEAPIEILIGVTILTFVLIIGFFTFQNTCAAQYEQKVRASVTLFANTLESVYGGGADASLPAQLDFSDSSSCHGSISDVRILRLNQDTCKKSVGLNSECYGVVVATTSFSTGATGNTLKERAISLVEPLAIPASVKLTYQRRGICLVAEDFSTGDYTIEDVNRLLDVEAPTSQCSGWALRLYNLRITHKGNEVAIEEG